jgi:hypothetical protein
MDFTEGGPDPLMGAPRPAFVVTAVPMLTGPVHAMAKLVRGRFG